MKTFNSLSKAIAFVALTIEGTYGEGFTLKDFKDYSVKHIKENIKHLGESFTIIRETGTQDYTEFGTLLTSEAKAREEAKRWYNSKFILYIHNNEGKYEVSSIKI